MKLTITIDSGNEFVTSNALRSALEDLIHPIQSSNDVISWLTATERRNKESSSFFDIAIKIDGSSG